MKKIEVVWSVEAQLPDNCRLVTPWCPTLVDAARATSGWPVKVDRHKLIIIKQTTTTERVLFWELPEVE